VAMPIAIVLLAWMRDIHLDNELQMVTIIYLRPWSTDWLLQSDAERGEEQTLLRTDNKWPEREGRRYNKPLRRG